MSDADQAMTDHPEVRRDAEQLQEFLRHAEYFDSEDGADQYADAIAALNRIVSRVEQAERREAALVEALRRISERQPAVVETLRANGIVFTTALGKPDDERTDAERWEKVAFSIYTDICEVDTQARAALTVYEQSQGKP